MDVDWAATAVDNWSNHSDSASSTAVTRWRGVRHNDIIRQSQSVQLLDLFTWSDTVVCDNTEDATCYFAVTAYYRSLYAENCNCLDIISCAVTMVERRSSAGELSLSRARPASDE